jgi:hypothetical protein
MKTDCSNEERKLFYNDDNKRTSQIETKITMKKDSEKENATIPNRVSDGLL